MSSQPGVLMLTTIRSHDQYNTTIYGMDDRYRGIKGRRDVVFANEEDMKERGLKHGDLIDITTAGDPSKGRAGRTILGQTIVAHTDFARLGCRLLSRGEQPHHAYGSRPEKRHAVLQVGGCYDPGIGCSRPKATPLKSP